MIFVYRRLYGLSKVIFNKILIKYSKKYKCKFRIIRLFQFDDGEDTKRLYSTIKKCAKKNTNLLLKNPFEIRNFNHIDFVLKIYLMHLILINENLNITKYFMYLNQID